jgi:WD40 repeat protein
VAFDPDGNHLASASADGTIRLWNPATGKEVHTLTGHALAVSRVVFSPDGQRLVSASSDRTIKVWDSVTGAAVLTLKGHTDRVAGVAFSPDGQRLASAGDDGTVRVWEAPAVEEKPGTKREVPKKGKARPKEKSNK